MKNIILTTICSFLFVFAIAQESQDSEFRTTEQSETMQTFNNSSKGTHGVYLGLGGGYANFDNFNFSTINGRIAYVIDQKFEIGLEGQSFHGFSALPFSNGNNGSIAGGVGGIHMKAIYFGQKKIHLSTPLFLGVGAVALISHYSDDIFEEFDPELVRASPLFVAEPGVNVEFNISKVFGFEVGAKYRLSHQTNLVANQVSNLDGLMIGATLKIGFFDFGGRNKKVKMRPADVILEGEKEDGFKNY